LNANVAVATLLAEMPAHEREIFFMGLSPQEADYLLYDWSFWGRPSQQEPPGEWSVWLALAGRGYGKTRMGAEWVRAMMCGDTPLARGRCGHMALVAETAADARDVMVQSSGGILKCHPPEFRPVYTPSLRKLTWPNGATAHTYSADDPEQLRGPEHEAAWSDELAKWRYAQETWDMLQFGLRVGINPQQLVTTTPRPIPVIKELLEAPDTYITRGSTYENYENLSPAFITKMERRYEGTRLGRQELHAEVLDDVPGALWTRRMLETRSATNPMGAGMRKGEDLPDMLRVTVGVDPSGTQGELNMRRVEARGGDHDDEVGDDIGIVAAGLGEDGMIYVLDDATVNWGPADWARRVVQTYNNHEADMIVGEANFGGAMVEHTIRTVDRRVPYRAVHASRGKAVRAEPIAALYEQGRVRHVYGKPLSKLEDQMIYMTQRGYEGAGSPDRLDAAVWAITDLMFGKSARGGAVSMKGGHH
jgi:predicted phage terminase large subunit-like protein